MSKGTKVYTLPEKEGSRFIIKGGKLNFTADNPYGETEGDKRYWDDYNVSIDKSYSPLKLTFTKSGDEEYDTNRKNYAQAIVSNKRKLQQEFGLTSDEYNHLAELALGIAEQESRFGTSSGYKFKENAGNNLIGYLKGLQSMYKPEGGRKLTKGYNYENIIHHITNPYLFSANQLLAYAKGNKMARSRGYTQIKSKGDNDDVRNIYQKYGINDENLTNADKSAVATIIRLAHMYNNEVKGRNFKSANGNKLSPYHALLYKWMGKNKELTKHTATPQKNIYINNINKYSRNFDMFEERTYDKYKLGGRISLASDY